MICQQCGKRRFATFQAAEAALRHLIAMGRASIRAYRAPCGWVHLTSMAPARTTRIPLTRS